MSVNFEKHMYDISEFIVSRATEESLIVESIDEMDEGYEIFVQYDNGEDRTYNAWDILDDPRYKQQ